MRARERFIGSALVLLIVGGGVAFCQNAGLLATVSRERRLTAGSAAALVGVVGGSLSIQTDRHTALDELRRIGYSVPAKSPDAPINVGEFSFLVMQLLDLPGGALYAILPGPRYAVRELEARGVLAPGTHAGAPISGPEALCVLGMLARPGP